MPPAIIADSDEEDNSYSPPRSSQAPFPPDSLGPEVTRSFAPASHTSTSTNPSFFQNIYDEQNDAARENARGELLDLASGAALSSSEVTAPAPFQRTVTELIDPSSLTSISDPAVSKDPKTSSGKGMSDWTQVSTPGRKKAPTAMMDEVWDVPSSPERLQKRKVIKIRLKRQDVKSASRSAEKPNLNERDSPSIKQTRTNYDHQKDDDTSVSGRRKKRKIDTSHPSPQGSNEVDLVAIPFSTENEDAFPEPQQVAYSSMLPPTLPPTYPPTLPPTLPPILPPDNEASFYISAKPLTDTQKLQYQSVHFPSSDSHLHDALPPILQRDPLLLASSGSATNVNTPRSEEIGYSAVPLASIAPDAVQTTTGPSTQPRPESSPDIISVVETPAQLKEIKQRGRPRKSTSEMPKPGEEVREIEQAQNEKSPYSNNRSNDTESDYSESPVKPKETKQRGRPRKSISATPKRDKGVKEVEQLDKEESSFAYERAIDLESDYSESLAKSKEGKQRGRPKKNVSETLKRDEEVREVGEFDRKESLSINEGTNDPEPGYSEPSVKPKKPRGRPRKNAGGEGAAPTQPVAVHPGGGETSTKQKKKRGRPRKQDKLDMAEVPDDITPAAETKIGVEIPRDGSPEEHSDQTNTTPVPETILKETSPNTSIKTSAGTPDKDKLNCSDAPTTEKGAKSAAVTPVPKSAGPTRGVSTMTPSGKPIYRVGLSKRSRIAPLLKSLRK
ncbi:hypothetical protein AK830_g7231 [Neonectria ditissima]|uniref:AT hook domain-containing protein n=1 Tax=Neonectria ditissima TaxID=78410 RepID=A0A0P7B040_9HYPO|nr:hypothetical protein AK830_g7231 [Neonectria ditissima]